MKKYSLALLILSVALISFFSCTKINEATELGGDLIPPVDNVNTFEAIFEAKTISRIYNDSSRVGYFDRVALGDIDDPRFGHMHANFAFNISAPVYGNYPFRPKKDTIHTVDSVVLSLSFAGAYGDTLTNGVQTVSVYEIDPNAGFQDSIAYKYNDPTSDFNGNLLGTKNYTIKNLKDTYYVREPGDTDTTNSKYVNVLRIKLNNSVGNRIMDFDTAINNPNSGFRNDSLFKTLFAGLSVKSSNTGNAFAYFNLSDNANTKMSIYYRYKKPNSNDDTVGVVHFAHTTFGQANYVQVDQGGNWATALNNATADQVYVQSSPSGAYVEVDIPSLDTFSNKVIHRAELIAPVVDPSTNFPAPSRLVLDRTRNDSALNFDNDLSIAFNGNDWVADYSLFGGTQKGGAYKFNITRYVQGIVTRNDRNDTLRIHAPFRTMVYFPGFQSYVPLTTASRIADGRVVLGGGNHPDPAKRTRLRIIYSNL